MKVQEGIYVLEASGRLSSFVDDLLVNAQKVKDKAREFLPLHEVDIIFRDNPERAIFHIGVGGFTPDQYTVFISLNPKFADFKKTVDVEMPRMLAHELFHAVRWEAHGMDSTLLECMITEGLADHFELQLSGGEIQRWDEALTAEELKKFGELVKDEYHNSNFNYTEWFLGLDEGNIPRWTGYTLGFNLVGEYLKKHPNKKASELYTLKAEEFSVTMS